MSSPSAPPSHPSQDFLFGVPLPPVATLWRIGAAVCSALLLFCIYRVVRACTRTKVEKEDCCGRIKWIVCGLTIGVYDVVSDFNFYSSLSGEEQESGLGKACLAFCTISAVFLPFKFCWDISVRSASNRLRSRLIALLMGDCLNPCVMVSELLLWPDLR